MAHWHSFNPWAATLIYPASVKEVVSALSPNTAGLFGYALAQAQYRGPVDVYIVAGGRRASLGIRYGKEPGDYLSVYVAEDKIAQRGLLKLFDKYSNPQGEINR